MSQRPAKRQRMELSLEKRIKLIKCAESVPNPTLKALSSKFGIGKSTVTLNVFGRLNKMTLKSFLVIYVASSFTDVLY